MSNLILTGLFLLILVISALWGFLRGLAKSRIRGISVLVCAIAAVLTAVLLRSTVASDAALRTFVIPLLEKAGQTQIIEMLGLSPTLNEVLLHCIYSIAAPFMALALFIAYSFLTWFIFVIVTLICGSALRKHNERSKFQRTRALIWGVVQGLVIFVILMIPISATLDLVPPVVNAVAESDALGDQEDEVMGIVEEYVAPLNSNALLVAYRGVGGDQITEALTSFTVNESTTQLSAEIDSVASFACNVMKLTKTEFAQYSSAEAVTIVALSDSFEGSVLLPTIAGEIIYGATDAWLNGNAFLGAAKPDFGESDALFAPFFDALLRILNADARNHAALQADIRTVAEMVAVMAENGVFANFSNTEALLETMSSNGIVASLVEKLGANASMKALIPELTDLGMRAIATTLGIPADVTEVYGDIMTDIADALNEASDLTGEEQINVITAELVTAFDEAGIPIDKEIIDGYSVSMIQDLLKEADGKELTADDVQAFFAIYAEQVAVEMPASDISQGLAAGGSLALADGDPYVGTVYEGKTEADLKKCGAAVLAKATVQLAALGEDSAEQAKEILTASYSELLANDADAFVRISSIEIKNGVSATSLEASSGLKSSETIVTYKVTMVDLLSASEGVAENITPETVKKEAAAIESIFSAAGNLLDQVSGGTQLDLTTVAGSLGTILDSLQETESVGSDKTAKLFTAVLQSETVRKTANLDMQTATQMAQKATEGEVKYTETMNAVSSGVDLFTKLGQDGEELTEEQLIELIRNINPATAGMIEVYVTAERITGYGVPAQYANVSAGLISEIFSYMANTEMSETEYQKEAKALNQILNVAISAKSHASGKVLFGEILPSATETVDTFMASNAVTHALREELLDQNGDVKEGMFDVFGLSDKIPVTSPEYNELVGALNAYMGSHQDQNTKLTVKALSALFGIAIAA